MNYADSPELMCEALWKIKSAQNKVEPFEKSLGAKEKDR
jgi:hypothetical protein